MRRSRRRRERLLRMLKLREQQCTQGFARELQQLRASTHAVTTLQQVVEEQRLQSAQKASSAVALSSAEWLQQQQQFMRSVHDALNTSQLQQQQQNELCQRHVRQQSMFKRFRERLAEIEYHP